MSVTIDYSAIPKSKQPSSAWDSLKMALLITISILIVISIGALLTSYTGHRDTIMAILGVVTLVITVGIVTGAFARGYQNFDKQKRFMRQFAHDNNWNYNEAVNTLTGLKAFPLNIGLNPISSHVRCFISGKIEGMPFELSHVTYLQSAELLGNITDSGGLGNNRIAWLTVLGIDGHPQLRKSPNLRYETDVSHTYIICPLNAYYYNDIQTMFNSIET